MRAAELLLKDMLCLPYGVLIDRENIVMNAADAKHVKTLSRKRLSSKASRQCGTGGFRKIKNTAPHKHKAAHRRSSRTGCRM